MSQIILDISPNTHKNDFEIIYRMINDLKKIDNRKHEIIFKTQVFKEAPPNLPITPEALNFFGFCAKLAGYQWTASVFDLESLELLMKYEEHLPFIKIPCRPELYWLAGEIKRKIEVYASIRNNGEEILIRQGYGPFISLCCIPQYPASRIDYDTQLGTMYFDGISDHTVGLELWYTYKPAIWEVHYKEPTSTGPDAGPFAKTLDDLKEVL